MLLRKLGALARVYRFRQRRLPVERPNHSKNVDAHLDQICDD